MCVDQGHIVLMQEEKSLHDMNRRTKKMAGENSRLKYQAKPAMQRLIGEQTLTCCSNEMEKTSWNEVLMRHEIQRRVCGSTGMRTDAHF
jgi:hypothetical protein